MHARALALLSFLLLSTLSTPALAQRHCPDVDVGVDVDADASLDAALRARLGLRFAGPRPEADLRAAADLALRGRATFEGGAELDALADLEQAYRLSGDASLAGMLGLSLRAAGRLPEAWAALHAFLEWAPLDARAALEARVRAALPEIEAQLGGLVIDGDLGARGEVILDGRLVATLPLVGSLDGLVGGALYLAPGPVHLEIRADGRLAGELDANVALGQIAHAHLDLALPSPRLRAGLFVPAPWTDAQLALGAALWARGRIAFDAGHELEALADLEAAFRITGDLAILGRLGLALQAAGRFGDAWIAMHLFLEGAAPDVRAQLEARVRAAMGELEARLGGVRIRGDLGAGAELRLRGRLVSRLPFDGAIHLDPGPVSLEVRADGRLAADLSANVVAGAIADLTVTLPAIGAGVGAVAVGGLAAPAPAVGGGLFGDTLAWVGVGIGAGLTVVLVVTGIVASVLNDQLSAHLADLQLTGGCAATPGLCSHTDIDIGTAFEWVGWLGAGVALTVAGTIALVAGLTADTASHVDAAVDGPDVDLDCDDDDRHAEIFRETSTSTQLTGMCAPWAADGAGLGCQISF